MAGIAAARVVQRNRLQKNYSPQVLGQSFQELGSLKSQKIYRRRETRPRNAEPLHERAQQPSRLLRGGRLQKASILVASETHSTPHPRYLSLKKERPVRLFRMVGLLSNVFCR